MLEISTVIDNYIAMWNETDKETRRALITQTLTEDATYIDPLMSGEGIDAITEVIGAAQEQFPAHRFTLVGEPEAHHDHVRFTLSLAQDGSEPVAIGVDFATVASDGRLRAVTGFLEPVA
jgi:SnoaL-like domain